MSLIASELPFVLIRGPGPVASAHWARWNRGPTLAALVNPEPADWDLPGEPGLLPDGICCATGSARAAASA